MRILLITQWFDPEPTFKGLLFARELQRLGHDVQVLTGFPNYPGGKIYDGYRVRVFQRQVIDGVPILRVPLFPSHDNSAKRRVLNYLSFAGSATLGALLVRRPDVAYVYHPPATVGLPAIVLKWLRGVPYVYDVQDLWPDTLSATGMISSHTALAIVGGWMQTVYRAAAEIVVLSEGFSCALSKRGISPGKVHIIHNWADERNIRLSPADPQRARELGFEGRFNVVFAGTMGKAQELKIVLDAAEILRHETKVRFVMIGAGVAVDELKEQARIRNLKSVTFFPRRPVSEIGEILTLADALLVHLKEDPLFEITVPSKTQAYLMAGRPILMGVRGDAAKLVRRANAGLAFAPGRADQLAATVRRLMEMSDADRSELCANGASFYRENLAMNIGAKRFEEVLDNASLTRPRFGVVKRGFDIAIAIVGILVLAAPLAALALLVRTRLGSPVLFRQSRPGKREIPFEIVKFRSMTDACDENGKLLPDAARITPFGAKLRSTSLDELPELWNVLKGDMSLVGPRPLLTRYTPHFTSGERLRLAVKPGITGWAQVNGRNATSWDERLAMDSWYVRNRSMRLDIKIILKTLTRVVRRAGVVVDPESVMQNLDDERRNKVNT
jgi:lipopolysaccharide/colanic/teichoic acid biosynthesis glycosyltransferase